MSETRCPLGRQDLRGPASRSRGLAERFRIRIRPWGSGTRACGPSVRGTPPPAAPGLGPARNQRARRGSRGRSGAPGADRAAVRGSATAWGRRSAASGPGRRGGAGGSAGPGAPDGCALAGRERRAPAGDAAGALSPGHAARLRPPSPGPDSPSGAGRSAPPSCRPRLGAGAGGGLGRKGAWAGGVGAPARRPSSRGAGNRPPLLPPRSPPGHGPRGFRSFFSSFLAEPLNTSIERNEKQNFKTGGGNSRKKSKSGGVSAEQALLTPQCGQEGRSGQGQDCVREPRAEYTVVGKTQVGKQQRAQYVHDTNDLRSSAVMQACGEKAFGPFHSISSSFELNFFFSSPAN